MRRNDNYLTAWLPIEEVDLLNGDGGGGGQPLAEGFIKDFIGNQVKKYFLAKFNDIKAAFLSGDIGAMKEVIAWVVAQAKDQFGITVAESDIVAVLELVLALISSASNLPNAIKEAGEFLIQSSAFLAHRPLYATIARQVGELLIAVAKELGTKPLLVGDATPDDRCWAAIEDFEATFITVGATTGPNADFGILEIITIGRLLFEAVQWWRRRRQEKRETPQLAASAEYDPHAGKPQSVLFLKSPGAMNEADAKKLVGIVEAKVGVPVVILWGGLEPELIDL